MIAKDVEQSTPPVAGPALSEVEGATTHARLFGHRTRPQIGRNGQTATTPEKPNLRWQFER